MLNSRIILLIFLFFFAFYAHSKKCATIQIFQTQKFQVQARQLAETCSPDDYYDSVQIKTTPHFALIYTTNGPHRVSAVFLDSLEKTLETAYKIFTKTHKTLPPLGAKVSYHYKKEVPNNLYPIEILELDLLRNLHSLVGENNCQYCMGITIPDETEQGASSIIIDNDFMHASSNASSENFTQNEKSCAYLKSDFPLKNETYNYTYNEKFGAGIRVTIYHELYHAIQLRYLDLHKNPTYWFEASASGIEEILAPDIDDYMSFVPTFFKMQWQSFEAFSTPYSLAPFFLTIYQKFGPTLDTKIWESFQNSPNQPFEKHFYNVISNKNLSPDSVFHSLATQLFFSGSRAKSFEDSSIYKDAPLWETPVIFDNSKEISLKGNPFFTYRKTTEFPDIKGYISYLYKDKNDSIFSKIQTNSFKDYREQFWKLQNADSVFLIYSRLQPITLDSSKNTVVKLNAYPNPYRGKTPLCFEGLKENSTLEIRTRKGSLALQKEHNTDFLCISPNEINEKFAPGLYLYRDGQNGKMKKLLIIK